MDTERLHNQIYNKTKTTDIEPVFFTNSESDAPNKLKLFSV